MWTCWMEFTTCRWGVSSSTTREKSGVITHVMTGSDWQRGETDLQKVLPEDVVLTLIQRSVSNDDWCFKLDTDSSVFCSAPDQRWLEGDQCGCSLESVIALTFVRHILPLIKANCDPRRARPHTHIHANTKRMICFIKETWAPGFPLSPLSLSCSSSLSLELAARGVACGRELHYELELLQHTYTHTHPCIPPTQSCYSVQLTIVLSAKMTFTLVKKYIKSYGRSWKKRRQ